LQGRQRETHALPPAVHVFVKNGPLLHFAGLHAASFRRGIRLAFDVLHLLRPAFGHVENRDGAPVVAGLRKDLDAGAPLVDHVAVEFEKDVAVIGQDDDRRVGIRSVVVHLQMLLRNLSPLWRLTVHKVLGVARPG
jgi:hypothetical protein